MKKSRKNKMKEYVFKWNASQKEVDANTQQEDELTEVEVPEDMIEFCNHLGIEVDGKVDDSEKMNLEMVLKFQRPCTKCGKAMFSLLVYQ